MLRVARKNVLELKLSPTTTTLPRKVSTASVSDVDVESSKIDASRRLQAVRLSACPSVCLSQTAGAGGNSCAAADSCRVIAETKNRR